MGSSLDKWWKVPRIWDGRDIYVIAGGPSLAIQAGVPSGAVGSPEGLARVAEFLAPIHSERIIGINSSYALGSWIDVLFFGDKIWWTWNKGKLNEWGGLIVTCCERPISSNRVRRVLRQHVGWEKKSNRLCWNSNSGFCAAHLGYLMGAKRIYLIGMDMAPSDNGAFHWHPEHPRPTTPDSYERFLGFEHQVARGARATGVEIINLNPHSRLALLPKQSLVEHLEKKGRQ